MDRYFASMKRRPAAHPPAQAFETARKIGLGLPDVEATLKYDGSPVLKMGGCFMAGLATHRSAEPDTLVVRSGFDERGLLLHEAPETYYVTDYYRRQPVVLVRLSCVDADALRDLLSASWRITATKARRRRSLAAAQLIPLPDPTAPNRAARARPRLRKGHGSAREQFTRSDK
jgi:hypothetical protein